MHGYGQDLARHQWKHRVIIVKTHDIESKKYLGQLKEFEKDIDGLTDRKIMLYNVVKDDFTVTDYKRPQVKSTGKISKQMARTILNQEQSFEVILIGLDGQTKVTQDQMLTKDALFAIIDAMPMRRNEIRH